MNNQFRRDKKSPCEDFWHTFKWGIAIALILFLALPYIL